MKIFMNFIFTVLLENLHIRSRPESHVHDLKLEFRAKRSQCFRDEISGGICKEERELFEFGEERFRLPSALNQYCTLCKYQAQVNDPITSSWKVFS